MFAQILGRGAYPVESFNFKFVRASLPAALPEDTGDGLTEFPTLFTPADYRFLRRLTTGFGVSADSGISQPIFSSMISRSAMSAPRAGLG